VQFLYNFNDFPHQSVSELHYIHKHLIMGTVILIHQIVAQLHFRLHTLPMCKELLLIIAVKPTESDTTEQNS
jgi:hypothetical protein